VISVPLKSVEKQYRDSQKIVGQLFSSLMRYIAYSTLIQLAQSVPSISALLLRGADVDSHENSKGSHALVRYGEQSKLTPSSFGNKFSRSLYQFNSSYTLSEQMPDLLTISNDGTVVSTIQPQQILFSTDIIVRSVDVSDEDQEFGYNVSLVPTFFDLDRVDQTANMYVFDMYRLNPNLTIAMDVLYSYTLFDSHGNNTGTIESFSGQSFYINDGLLPIGQNGTSELVMLFPRIETTQLCLYEISHSGEVEELSFGSYGEGNTYIGNAEYYDRENGYIYTTTEDTSTGSTRFLFNIFQYSGTEITYLHSKTINAAATSITMVDGLIVVGLKDNSRVNLLFIKPEEFEADNEITFYEYESDIATSRNVYVENCPDPRSDDSRLFVATGTGLYILHVNSRDEFSSETISETTLSASLGDIARAVSVNQGLAYVCGDDGLAVINTLDPTADTLFSYGSGDRYRNARVDSEGQLLVAANTLGLYEFNPEGASDTNPLIIQTINSKKDVSTKVVETLLRTDQGVLAISQNATIDGIPGYNFSDSSDFGVSSSGPFLNVSLGDPVVVVIDDQFKTDSGPEGDGFIPNDNVTSSSFVFLRERNATTGITTYTSTTYVQESDLSRSLSFRLQLTDGYDVQTEETVEVRVINEGPYISDGDQVADYGSLNIGVTTTKSLPTVSGSGTLDAVVDDSDLPEGITADITTDGTNKLIISVESGVLSAEDLTREFTVMITYSDLSDDAYEEYSKDLVVTRTFSLHVLPPEVNAGIEPNINIPTLSVARVQQEIYTFSEKTIESQQDNDITYRMEARESGSVEYEEVSDSVTNSTLPFIFIPDDLQWIFNGAPNSSYPGKTYDIRLIGNETVNGEIVAGIPEAVVDLSFEIENNSPSLDGDGSNVFASLFTNYTAELTVSNPDGGSLQITSESLSEGLTLLSEPRLISKVEEDFTETLTYELSFQVTSPTLTKGYIQTTVREESSDPSEVTLTQEFPVTFVAPKLHHFNPAKGTVGESISGQFTWTSDYSPSYLNVTFLGDTPSGEFDYDTDTGMYDFRFDASIFDNTDSSEITYFLYVQVIGELGGPDNAHDPVVWAVTVNRGAEFEFSKTTLTYVENQLSGRLPVMIHSDSDDEARLRVYVGDATINTLVYQNALNETVQTSSELSFNGTISDLNKSIKKTHVQGLNEKDTNGKVYFELTSKAGVKTFASAEADLLTEVEEVVTRVVVTGDFQPVDVLEGETFPIDLEGTATVKDEKVPLANLIRPVILEIQGIPERNVVWKYKTSSDPLDLNSDFVSKAEYDDTELLVTAGDQSKVVLEIGVEDARVETGDPSMYQSEASFTQKAHVEVDPTWFEHAFTTTKNNLYWALPGIAAFFGTARLLTRDWSVQTKEGYKRQLGEFFSHNLHEMGYAASKVGPQGYSQGVTGHELYDQLITKHDVEDEVERTLNQGGTYSVEYILSCFQDSEVLDAVSRNAILCQNFPMISSLKTVTLGSPRLRRLTDHDIKKSRSNTLSKSQRDQLKERIAEFLCDTIQKEGEFHSSRSEFIELLRPRDLESLLIDTRKTMIQQLYLGGLESMSDFVSHKHYHRPSSREENDRRVYRFMMYSFELLRNNKYEAMPLLGIINDTTVALSHEIENRNYKNSEDINRLTSLLIMSQQLSLILLVRQATLSQSRDTSVSLLRDLDLEPELIALSDQEERVVLLDNQGEKGKVTIHEQDDTLSHLESMMGKLLKDLHKPLSDESIQRKVVEKDQEDVTFGIQSEELQSENADYPILKLLVASNIEGLRDMVGTLRSSETFFDAASETALYMGLVFSAVIPLVQQWRHLPHRHSLDYLILDHSMPKLRDYQHVKALMEHFTNDGLLDYKGYNNFGVVFKYLLVISTLLIENEQSKTAQSTQNPQSLYTVFKKLLLDGETENGDRVDGLHEFTSRHGKFVSKLYPSWAKQCFFGVDERSKHIMEIAKAVQAYVEHGTPIPHELEIVIDFYRGKTSHHFHLTPPGDSQSYTDYQSLRSFVPMTFKPGGTVYDTFSNWCGWQAPENRPHFTPSVEMTNPSQRSQPSSHASHTAKSNFDASRRHVLPSTHESITYESNPMSSSEH